MAVQNCNVTDFDYNVFQGDVVPAGVANLTISEVNGNALSYTEFLIGGAVFSQGGWVGGNVAPEITKVVFTDNNNGTVNAAVHHTAFVVNAYMEIRLDIDRKPVSDHPPIVKGCTDSNAVNYNPLATSDDGSCFYVKDPVGSGNVLDVDHDLTVHGAEIEVPKENDPLLGNVNISHGSNALFDVVLYDKTAGKEYDFFSGGFDPKLKSASDNRRFQEQRAGGYKNIPSDLFAVNFPKVSVNTEYEFYVVPKSAGTKLAADVPSRENPFKFIRRIDTTITLALATTSYSSNWTIASSDVSLTDRPGKQPKATSKLIWPRDVEENPLLTSSIMDGQPGYKYFTLTATFDGGGSKSASKTSDALNNNISNPSITTGENLILPSAYLADLTTTFSANVLTVKGLFKVDKFGSYNQDYTIDIDEIITVT